MSEDRDECTDPQIHSCTSKGVVEGGNIRSVELICCLRGLTLYCSSHRRRCLRLRSLRWRDVGLVVAVRSLRIVRMLELRVVRSPRTG